jgi:reactive intermediate/imine deaminase
MTRPRSLASAALALALLVPLASCRVAPAAESAEAAEAPTATAAQEAVELEYLNPPGASPSAPYSEAVRVGDILYLSGKIGLAGREDGIQGETRAVLESMQEAVERYGSSMDRVFKCLVILADISEFGAMNEVYTSFFEEGRRPARSTFAASGLAAGARVEIECMAAL